MRLFKKIIYQFYILRHLDVLSYLKYFFAKRNSIVAINVLGVKIIVRKSSPDIGVAISCFTGEFSCLSGLLDKNYNGVIIDAGGYIGTSALAIHKMYPNAKIIVLEPSIENFNILKQNTNNVSNIKPVFGALLGGVNNNVVIRDRGTGPWGFTSVQSPADNFDCKKINSAPGFTLESLISSSESVGILKLDIEGGEYDVFLNSASFLKSIDIIFVELHDRIVSGCTELFTEFSSDRIISKSGQEKFLSIKEGTV